MPFLYSVALPCLHVVAAERGQTSTAMETPVPMDFIIRNKKRNL